MRQPSTLFAIALTVLVTTGTDVGAQVVITSPTGPSFPAGPDFASDVLSDPWDFANAEDLSQDPDFVPGWANDAQARSLGTGVHLTNGRFIGTSANIDPYLTLLDRGGFDIVNPGRTGLRFPIPSNRYQKIAIRVSYGATGSKTPAVYWFHRPDWHPQALTLSHYGYKVLTAASAAGPQTLIADLSSASGGVAWTGYEAAVRGLRFDPITQGGVAVEVDWVRMTVADNDQSAAIMRGTVGCGGSWQLHVIDSVTTTVAQGTGSGNWSFNYGIFPPGAYLLRLVCGGTIVNSVPFTINDAPRIVVVSPHEMGGEDYATSPHFAAAATSGAWDMEQPGDVAAISNAAVALTPAPGGHQLSGVNTNGDVQVTLLGSANNARPIPSTRYRHLTFTLTVDGAYDLGLGSVARVFWATSPWDGQNVTTTSQDIKVFPGRHTYTVDLGSLSSVSDPLLGRTIEYECAVCPTTPWGAKGIWSLRIDPHEFVAPRGFHLDNVFLRATEEVALGGAPFAVRWWIADSDAVAGQHTVRVYWDNDQTPDAGFASGSSSKLIATRSGALVNALDQAMWTPSPSMPPGEYFMYVHVTDGATGASRGMYSSGRIRVFQPVSPPVITTLRPAFGGTAFVPFAIEGCAGETAAPTGSGVDDLIVYAIGGPTVEIPAQRGQRFALGLLPSAPGLGTQQTGLPCPGGATPGIAASGGFRISGLSDLSAGPWTLRVLARGVNSRVFGVQDIPFVVDWRSGPARNLRLAATSGSSITIAWDPPVEGRAVTAYRIEVALTPAFSPLAGQVRVPPNVTSGSGVLGNGSWFVRVVTESAYSNQGPPSNVLGVTLPGGGAPSPGVPPGSPVLRVVQVTSNAVSLSWTAGGGGAPTSYVLAAGTGPGASNLGVFNVSGLTSVSSPIPAGVPIYARVVASNVAGSAASNEVVFTAAGPTPPARPTMNPPAVSGRNVTLSWGGVAGATSYTVIARLPGTSTVITSLPGQTGTSVYVPNVPPGTYAASVVAFNAAGPSPESNQVLVVVQ